MLKKRIIASLVIKNGMVVQSTQFNNYKPIGRAEVAVEFLNDWGIDEIYLLDIDATSLGRAPAYNILSSVVPFSRSPMTVGGGVKTLEHVRQLVRLGADKVSVNSEFVKRPEIVTEIARVFGSQCVVVSLDVMRSDNRDLEVVVNNGRVLTGKCPIQLAKQAELYGAGELLISSVDRNGTGRGLDLELARAVVDGVSIPVTISGGVGCPSHVISALQYADLSGVAIGNYFHFSEHSVTTLKAATLASGLPIRIDTFHTYDGYDICPNSGRIPKRDASVLKDLMYTKLPIDVI